jgi:hypothetical protein
MNVTVTTRQLKASYLNLSLMTIIRPSLETLESGACSANSIHVIWDHIRLANIFKIV